MIALPLLVFIGTLLLAVAFECGYAFVNKRWSTPFDKAPWGLIYWIAVGVVVATNQLIPQTPQMPSVLVPFGFVVLVHLLICDSGCFFERCGTHNKASGNTRSSTSRSPSNKELPGKRQACQNNNNSGPEGDEE